MVTKRKEPFWVKLLAGLGGFFLVLFVIVHMPGGGADKAKGNVAQPVPTVTPETSSQIAKPTYDSFVIEETTTEKYIPPVTTEYVPPAPVEESVYYARCSDV